MSATNRSPKSTPFSLPSASNAALTGLSHVPSKPSGTKGSALPSVAALHDPICTAHYYDITPAYTSPTALGSTGMPLVSINRPCYTTASSFQPWPEHENNTFWEETASWLHNHILPAVWSTFALPNDCSGLVLMSHSMDVPPTIIAARLRARQLKELRALGPHPLGLGPRPVATRTIPRPSTRPPKTPALRQR